MQKSVVIIEDEPSHAELALKVFQEPPAWRTLWLPDGEEGLNFLLRHGKYTGAWVPNLVILNLLMPKRHGLEVLQAVKKQPELSVLPIVVWSIGMEPKEIRLAYELGAAAYFSKPAKEEQLLTQLRIIRMFWDCAQLPQG